MLLKDKRIFYIEDDLKNRSIVQAILEQAGARFSFERWGKDETLQRLHDFSPVDIILLDLMFPDHVSGYDIYARIRADSQFAAVPILIVSAADPAIEMPKARKLGLSGFIAKPIDFRLFPQQIADCLAGQAVWYAT